MRKPQDTLPFEKLNAVLRGAAEPTRLRILALLAQAELTVSDLTEILSQSQPRISRHLRLLTEAGLVQRAREGSWAFFRLPEEESGAAFVRSIVSRLDPADPVATKDSERLAAVRTARAEAAQAYFRSHAGEWDRIRDLHVSDDAVEAAVLSALGDRPFRSVIDLGTGTGRILELLAPHIERGLGIDLSTAMLSVARARLDRPGLRHCSVRHADIFDLPVAKDSFDVAIVHQVLHFLDDGGRAVREAARVLRPGGRLLVIDFAPHELEFLREQHAHRRLGFPAETVTQWLAAAGLEPMMHRTLQPDAAGQIPVSLWLARDPRMQVADAVPHTREVA